MHKPLADVRAFHEMTGLALDQPLPEVGDMIPMKAIVGAVNTATAIARGQADSHQPIEARLAYLRAALLLEEVAETLAALGRRDRVEVADGLADVCYVAAGMAATYGIPLGDVWDEVQRSNMAKSSPCEKCDGAGIQDREDPQRLWDDPPSSDLCADCRGTGRQVIRDATGKVLKPPGWTPPNIAAVLTTPA